MIQHMKTKWWLAPLITMAVISAVLLVPKQSAIAQEPYIEGKHYVAIKTPVRTLNPKKIEVTEVFWYGCGHCNTFRPIFEQWKKQQAEDVNIQHSPAIWRNNMSTHAKIYYTAKALNVLDATHKDIFDAIHLQKKKMLKPDEIFPIFAKQGIEREKFDKTFSSFGVNSMVQQANARARSYGVTGTPEVVVNGKYRITAGMAGSQVNMLKVAEFLVNKERQALSDS